MKRYAILLGLVLLFSQLNTNAKESITQLFKNNSAIIYTINIRNFGAVDKDNDELIKIENGDIKGTFLNAIPKLSQLQKDGINTIYLLPVTKTGKLKALGTAGSLYALDSFNKIAPELDDTTNDISVFDEAKEFVDKAHELNINVILDLPSCGSYDLSLNKPDWFMSDSDNKAQIPADWTDVRLFKVYNDDKTLNKETLDNFKNFVDLTINLGMDGIRADVAAIKPYEFWKEIISYAKNKKTDFIFLAEASPSWTNPAPKNIAKYATIDELLKAGFDTYYGSFSDFKELKTKKEFDKKMQKNIKILKKNKDKTIISAFATHDQQAPILRGKNYWEMVLWLSTTLPLNTYFLDGFSNGDSFTYLYENKKATLSTTDDEFYFVHSGMFDIFNYTRPAKNNAPYLKNKYIDAINFKKNNIDLYKTGNYSAIKTDNDSVFGYTLTNNSKQLVVIGSLDSKNPQSTTIKPSYLTKPHVLSFVKTKGKNITTKNSITTSLEPLEIKVYLINLKDFQAN